METPQPHPQDSLHRDRLLTSRNLLQQYHFFCCFWSRKLSSQDLPIAEACSFIFWTNRQELGGPFHTARHRTKPARETRRNGTGKRAMWWIHVPCVRISNRTRKMSIICTLSSFVDVNSRHACHIHLAVGYRR